MYFVGCQIRERSPVHIKHSKNIYITNLHSRDLSL